MGDLAVGATLLNRVVEFEPMRSPLGPPQDWPELPRKTDQTGCPENQIGHQHTETIKPSLCLGRGSHEFSHPRGAGITTTNPQTRKITVLVFRGAPAPFSFLKDLEDFEEGLNFVSELAFLTLLTL